jgi:hypothetical protein
VKPLATTAATLATGSLLALAACGTPAGGDPGGRRLHELSGDPVFAALPDGATMIHTKRTPAHYRQPGFSGGGWDGPGLELTFRTSTPPADVYRFYAEQAGAAGWRATAAGALGLTDRWAKTYPDGAPATLVLTLLTRAPAVSERLYTLSGGVAPVAR